MENDKFEYNGTVLNVSDDILHINPIYIVPIALVVLCCAVYIVIIARKTKRNKKENKNENEA